MMVANREWHEWAFLELSFTECTLLQGYLLMALAYIITTLGHTSAYVIHAAFLDQSWLV